MSELHQALMNQAYDRFQANPEWSKDQFIMRLSWEETVAVTIGNLNYQVGNGGFMQWHDNGYSQHSTQLLEALNEVDTDISKAVVEMVLEFMDMVNGYDLRDDDEWEAFSEESDRFDTRFYQINDQLLADTEAHLSSLQQAA